MRKFDMITELYNSACKEISAPEEWQAFLRSACRNYKLTFDEQLLVYAQRPEATAVLELNAWNKGFRRWVNRGATGIAVFDRNFPGKQRLKYFFDVADTHAGQNARLVPLWEVKPQHEGAVIETLESTFGSLAQKNSLAYAISSAAENAAEDNFSDYFEDLLLAKEASMLDGLPEETVKASFKKLLASSIAFMMLERCGLSTENSMDGENFMLIRQFSTPNTLNAIGLATSDIGEMALREIASTVLNLERKSEKNIRTFAQEPVPWYDENTRQPIDNSERMGNDESDKLFDAGRLQATRINTAAPARDGAGQIRTDAQEAPGAAPQGAFREPANQLHPEPAPTGNSGNSHLAHGADDGRDGKGTRGERRAESQRPDKMGGAYEQHTPLGGGSNFIGAGVQLEPPINTQQKDTGELPVQGSPQMSFFDAEIMDFPVADYQNQDRFFRSFEISQQVIDEALCLGGNEPKSLERICSFFAKDYPLKENAVFLKQEYGKNGKGFYHDGHLVSLWFDENGLRIAEGRSGQSPRAVVLSWDNVAQRIRVLLDEGRFVPQSILENAADNEIKDISAKLWYLVQNFTERAEHANLLPSIAEIYGTRGGFPTNTAAIAELLRQPQSLEKLVQEMHGFVNACREDGGMLRFSQRNEEKTLKQLEGLQRPALQFSGAASFVHQPKQFITEDEIDNLLTFGSNIQHTKFRVFSCFLQKNTAQERMAFLKKEYGIGGKSWAGFHESHDSKGIEFSRGDMFAPHDRVLLKWPQVEKRIGELIRKNRYMSEKELAYIPKYEKNQLAREIYLFYSDLDMDHQRPYPNAADFYSAAPVIEKILSETAQLKELIQLMPPVQEATPLLDRHYATRKRTMEDVIAFSEGRYSLFGEHSLLPAKGEKSANEEEETEQKKPLEPSAETQVEPSAEPPAEQENEPIAEQSTEQAAEQTDIVGKTFEYDGRQYRVESISEFTGDARLLDITFQHQVGFPITRLEPANIVRGWVQNQLEVVLDDTLAEEEQTKSAMQHSPPTTKNNHRITDDHLGEGGTKTKYAFNIAAIKTLQSIESVNRLATPEEQDVLAKYVGWGGLPQAFDEKNTSWASEVSELKALLSPDDYASARATVLNAHYTSPVVIKAIYKAVENMGFVAGNILDPGCGVGNFQGLLPESMAESKMFGVEIDSITGRIARQLYQKNSIAIEGFERSKLPDSFFDLAIGNIPFGNFGVADKRYDKHKFLIHDFFFAKTLDKVRPGGIVAFITSKGTMDKQNLSVRKYIAQRADLLGAIRLPQNTFLANAGTQVTSDIIFLQKRDRMVDIEPDWVHLEELSNVPVNSYFATHPEMILGEMVMESGPFGMESACKPFEGADLSAQLEEAIQNIHAEYTAIEREQEGEQPDLSIPANPAVRNFSYTLHEGKIYFRENSRMAPVELSLTAENRVRGMIGICGAVRSLIELQTQDGSDADILAGQAKLNRLYDDFTGKYGLLSSRANSSAFAEDSSYSLLASLEILNENGELERKADMFTKRTIKPHIEVLHVDTASEALAVSIAERAAVDIEFMSQLSGKTAEQLVADLSGVIFRLPAPVDNAATPVYQTADEYLSGNVRKKLAEARQAADISPMYAVNAKALEKVQPVELSASEINLRLGAVWLPPSIVRRFIFQLLDTPNYAQWNVKVHYSKHTAEWNITGKSSDSGNVRANSAYGTNRVNAYKIIEETLNLRDVRVFDYVEEDGRRKAVLNKKETAIAQAKQELIKSEFADWVWAEPERREKLVAMYNEKFNSLRPREYDGSHIRFSGISPEIQLHQHQVNAIAHILYGGNTLLAHVVGAGKTFEMVAAAMESKRLGLCNKSLFVVPNHLTEQMASEFLQLYPSANILVATRKDFEAKNRKKFCGRIATGDFDAVIIGHSQFEKIPMSMQRQCTMLEIERQEILEGIQELKHSHGERFTIKQLEKIRKSIDLRLEKLNDQSRKDDVVCFEELGVDRLFVDEAHNFKNLYSFTKMRNVAGIAQTEAQKSADLYMKTRYLDELTGERGVIFATGTPISNSMVELFTMQRYLQYGALKNNGLHHFDAWASTFGETQTAIELSPEGSGYRAKTRFAKFYNIPELMCMFKEVADIQTADMLNLPVPKANFHNVAVKPSAMQKEMVAGLAKRADKVRNRMVEPYEDNMLLITNDGRKLALDQRLANPLLPDEADSKVNACVKNVLEIWGKHKAQRLTQLVFSDLSTPKNDGNFNVYHDIRDKLIAAGVPADEIHFIHDADSEVKKKELFAKVRKGDVRVLLGSTAKLGAGTNVQDKLVALHDLDVPWRPSDLEQRSGRIIRQGNKNPEVEVFRYVTEQTFDAYSYQLIESKQKFISQIMTSKSPVRSAEDVDGAALSYAEIKMLATGNPAFKEKMQLDMDVGRLRLLKQSHLSQKFALEDSLIKQFPQQIRFLEERIAGLEGDALTATQHKAAEGEFAPMIVEGSTFSDKASAGAAILAACKAKTKPEATPLGSYRSFEMSLAYTGQEFMLILQGKLSYKVLLGTDLYGNLTRIDNTISGIGSELEDTKARLENTLQQAENAQKETDKPFTFEAELKEKSARLDEVNALLNMDEKGGEILDGDTQDEPGRAEKENERER